MGRCFVFLQGPHGPFFGALARVLARAGHATLRVGFNAGDRLFWPASLPYHGYLGDLGDWPGTVVQILADVQATDLVLYGDTRSQHSTALARAAAAGLRLHVFEEGYLRPHWITYERGGANGYSRLMALSDGEILAAADSAVLPPNPPAHWGAMRQHIVNGALYHFAGLVGGRAARLPPHRTLGVPGELLLYLRVLAALAPHRLDRALATRAIRRGAFPYHLVLLQLAHDASFRQHGPFADMPTFLAEVISDFAAHAPVHHHLVFKAHPLEDGRVPLRRTIRRLAAAHGVAPRVHFVRGGKLAQLLDRAATAITVNSTAAHQALWRGLPLKAYGTAIYARPGLVSGQSLGDFLRAPDRPDMALYHAFRAYLLATSQVPGSFYSAAGRREVLRRIVDMMLADADPYAALQRGKTAPRPPVVAAPWS
ncbi:MAG: capsule biosynthesis protein CapA [Pseudomonadota bacterium]